MSQYEIIALNAFKDNYIWVIHNANSAIVVDPGEAQPVLKFLQKNNLQRVTILLTHTHADHNGGVTTLLRQYPDASVADNSAQTMVDNQLLSYDGFPIIRIITTPGHVYEHVCYVFDEKHLFCGDTLFSLGCGRVFTGDYVAAFTSLLKLKQLDKNILCYPAHEYTTSNIRFTTSVDSKREYYQDFAKYLVMKLASEQNSLPTLLENELKYNLFLRCDDKYVQQIVAAKSGADCSDELNCFIQLRELRNNF